MTNKEKHPNTYTIKQILIFCFLTLGLFIGAMVIVEKFSGVLINIFLILLPSIFDLVKESIEEKKRSKKKFRKKKIARKSEENFSLIQAVESGVESLGIACKNTFQNSKVRKTTMWLAIIMISASVAGSMNSTERFVAAIIAFVHPETVEENLDGEKEDEPELDEEEKEWLESQNSELVETVKGLEISKTELQKERTLSASDKNQIYFLGGDFAIKDWNDEQEVFEKVRLYLEFLNAKQKKNVFDLSEEKGGAPERIKGEIAQISEEEPTIKSFAQRYENMGTRQNTYQTYPKRSLANLISNDEHILALTLFYNQGNMESIEYYYSKAIQYRFEKLGFEGLSNDYIKGELEWIAARYKDIVFTCPDSDVKEYAAKLQKAFETLAAEY